jgi:hypothetical protein
MPGKAADARRPRFALAPAELPPGFEQAGGGYLAKEAGGVVQE